MIVHHDPCDTMTKGVGPVRTYLEETWAGMSWAERKVFEAAAKALGHTKETLTEDDDATVTLRKIAAGAGKELGGEAADQVAEALFDAAHEHCEDGCYGGGRPWYDPVAARLVDPAGPLAAIAVAQQITRDDTDNADGRESLDNTAWLGLLRTHYRSVSAAKDDDEARRRLVDMGALVVEWLADLDKRQPAATASRPSVSSDHPGEPCNEACDERGGDAR